MTCKRKLHQAKHPINSYPFEALNCGSWRAVEYIKIASGTVGIHFMDNHHVAIGKGPSADIRVRSRKAALLDCSCILRPGIDVCVLSNSQGTDNSDAPSLEPIWVDAKISSVQRKPHESECACQYYVNFYVNQGSLGAELRTLSKETKEVGINQICILQRLEHHRSEEDHPYRWASSEDCSSLPQTRLFIGKFLPDLSWLLVASVVKKVSFSVRSVNNKLVYQILGSDTIIGSSLSTQIHVDVLNFKVNNDVLVPVVAQVVTTNTKRVNYAHESLKEEVQPSYNVEGLRRSKRRNVQPERYIGSGTASLEVGYVKTRPYKLGKEDEMSLPLSCLFGLPKKRQEQDVESTKVDKVNSTSRELQVYRRRDKTSSKVKSSDADENEHKNQLAIIPHPDLGEPLAVEHYDLKDNVVARTSGHRQSAETYSKYSHLTSGPKLKKNMVNLLTFEPHHSPAKSDDAGKNDGFSSRSHYMYGTSSKSQRKGFNDMDDMDLLGTRWEGIQSNRGAQEKKYHSSSSRYRHHEREKTYRDRTLNATAYKDLINSYLQNISSRPTQEEPCINDQWKQFQESVSIGQTRETGISHKMNNEEDDDLDMLWREMEVSLASTYFTEDAEGSNAPGVAETQEKSRAVCQHDCRLDEEIGIYCLKCGTVTTEIKHILPPFIEQPTRYQEEKQCSGEDSKPKADEDDDFPLFSAHASPDRPISEENDNVWALIPELRNKLHLHQKKAFEFLWKNIAGSMHPALMEEESNKRGGCVISHTPGAGKTFLIIAFLVSYLKLFPGKRPLVIAPKTTLYTWYKEFIKWEIPIPVYLIHGRRTYRVFKQKTSSMVFPGIPKPTEDVKHVLDCLEKIQKWHSHPSVLVMGYTSFLTLMRENSKFAHRTYMAKVLRESPGLLVLDEGHNPRSTKSRLRKVLMKVHTDLRILLSGTLFQNNFCEYFNTLCLARPKFSQEVLEALDPKYRKKKKRSGKTPYATESRARKLFLDTIAKKIDANIGEERMEGLNMLRNLTNGFIDVYEGSSSDDLPGLQIYTLLMNTTNIQHEILEGLHKRMVRCNGYPLEVELLITLGSIHPWLVKTAVCADKFFSLQQLDELEKCKFDLKIGSKVRFVLSLIYRVVKKEKVLIFCHNIAPVKLFVEYFEKYFGWQKGREVLVLTGDLELFERGRVMDKFEEPGGVSKILLASITACAEGISLTAASRVIMLDSEWNPSKTKQAIARAFRPGQQKMVYVYQLLVSGSLEEDKYRRTTWKEWVSSMIFSEAFVEDPSKWQAEKIEDDILREMVEEDRSKSFHMIMKNEKASTNR